MPRNYIGGTTREARLKYYDIDTNLTALIKEVAAQYLINPNLLASRIADEGPIDEAIRDYNINDLWNGWLLSQYTQDDWDEGVPNLTHSANWGLDDLYDRIQNKEVLILGDYPNIKARYFKNELGRETNATNIPSLRFGIEATAAELMARRNKLKNNYPSMSDEWYDAASQASFNYGESGVKKFGTNIPSKFNPYIVLKRLGGRLIPRITKRFNKVFDK